VLGARRAGGAWRAWWCFRPWFREGEGGFSRGFEGERRDWAGYGGAGLLCERSRFTSQAELAGAHFRSRQPLVPRRGRIVTCRDGSGHAARRSFALWARWAWLCAWTCGP
jgi:hypothetical protein